MSMFTQKANGLTWASRVVVAISLAITTLVPLAQNAYASSTLFNQDINLSAGETKVISVNLTQGSFVRVVSYGTDANGSSVWTENKKPDGSNWNSISIVKSSGAGTSANTIGPIPTSGSYQFSLYYITKTYVGSFNLKFLQVDAPQDLTFDKNESLDFSQVGEAKAVAINLTKGEKIRFVTQSTSKNSTIWSDFYRPDGTSYTLYSFRDSGAGTKAADFEANQNGKYTFILHYSSPSDLGKITITAIKSIDAGEASVGNPKTISFKKPGERVNVAIKVTQGYKYRLVTKVKDSNASTIWADYTRPDGTTDTFFMFRNSGAGTQVTDLGPMRLSGEYIFSLTKSTPSDTSELSLTLLRVEKPILIKSNTPTTIDFAQPGQAISIAFAVNKGDLVQLQTESTIKELGLSADYVRPDGTSNTYYNVRFSGAGRQLDTKEPVGYSQTGFYVFTLRPSTASVVGKVTLTVLGSTNSATDYVSDLGTPEEGEYVVVPTPDATPSPEVSSSPVPSPSPTVKTKAKPSPSPTVKTQAKPTPSPTKKAVALSKAPAKVSLDVTTKELESHTDAVTTVTYNGDINDPASKPSAFNFYEKSQSSNAQKLVASVAISDAKCSEKTSTKYSCTFPTFNPYTATSAVRNVLLRVSATNAKGTGEVSNIVGIYADMVEPIGGNWKITKWAEVSDAIFGTGMKNWFGFRSRSGKSPIEATFIFEGVWPQNPKYKITFAERFANKKSGDIIAEDISNLKVEHQGTRHVVTVPSVTTTIRGDSAYIAIIEIMNGTELAVRGRHSVRFSLDYKMSLGCSSSLLILQTARDTSKGTLSTISLALSTTVLAVNEILNKSGIKKLDKNNRLKLEKKLAVLTGYAELAGAGVDLIDVEAALSSGDITLIKTEVTGIIKDRVEGAVSQTIDKKAGTTVLEWKLAVEDGLELLDFLKTQGDANGDFITDNCS